MYVCGGMHLGYLYEIVLSFTMENTNFIQCVDESISYTFYCIGYFMCTHCAKSCVLVSGHHSPVRSHQSLETLSNLTMVIEKVSGKTGHLEQR